jgi:hypothetical protein
MSQQISRNAHFTLYLDGAAQSSSVDVDVANGVIRRFYLTNYPAGLTGIHTFVGIWTLDGVEVQNCKALSGVIRPGGASSNVAVADVRYLHRP